MNLSWLLPAGKGIPVLMYHKVWPGTADGLTITPERLREHFTFLKSEGYHTLSLTDFIEISEGRKPGADKAILITFDDGYLNNLTYVYPLLKELGWQATFFIIGRTLERDGAESGPDQKMTPDELRLLDPATVQLGIHGYDHEHMGNMDISGMDAALTAAIDAFEQSGLVFHKVFAYPYGARPGAAKVLVPMKNMMREKGIKAAFRIGNRVSKVPAPDIYEINRIDIKGTDTIATLKIKLSKGKLKPF